MTTYMCEPVQDTWESTSVVTDMSGGGGWGGLGGGVRFCCTRIR